MNTNEILTNITFESEWDKNIFARWLLSIAEMFENSDIKAALTEKESLCKMFYSQQKSASVNRQKYQQVKKNILTLADYHGITATIPTREEVLESNDVSFLYKDLDSLLQFIDDAGNLKLANYDANTDMLNIKAIAILGWRGIRQDEIVLIEKKDITPNYIVTNKGNIPITETDYEILQRFSVITEYRGFPGGRRVILRSAAITEAEYEILKKFSALPNAKRVITQDNDNYLFRAGRSSESKEDEIVPDNSIAKVLDRFNDAVSDMGKAIFYRYLRKNALFTELYDDLKNAKQPVNLLEEIQKRFNCAYHAAHGYRTEYNLWLNKFHNPK